MRGLQYESTQTRLLPAWQSERDRMSHVQRLTSIYNCTPAAHSHRTDLKALSMYHKNKLAANSRKQTQLQARIDHDNQSLRNKLIRASIPSVKKLQTAAQQGNPEQTEGIQTHYCDIIEFCDGAYRKLYSSNKELISAALSHSRKERANKIREENRRMLFRLSTMKGEIMPKLGVEQHMRRTEQFKELLSKKSPRKRKLRQSFFKKLGIDIYANPVTGTLSFFSGISRVTAINEDNGVE